MINNTNDSSNPTNPALDWEKNINIRVDIVDIPKNRYLVIVFCLKRIISDNGRYKVATHAIPFEFCPPTAVFSKLLKLVNAKNKLDIPE
tara:strand:+ start:130 stop:396 length:267 start_codon:yes stop_codon:yes gene_type:complete